MKNAVFTFVGLVGLSAAGGVALVASHTALAAGPRLPDYVVRAHAVAAAHSENVVAVSLTTEPGSHRADVQPDGHGSAYEGAPALSDRGSDIMVLSNQGTGLEGLAPTRALRPVARDETSNDALFEVAQAAPTQTQPAVTRQIATPVAAPPRPQRFTAVRRVFQPRATRTSGTIKPGYLHGVFR